MTLPSLSISSSSTGRSSVSYPLVARAAATKTSDCSLSTSDRHILDTDSPSSELTRYDAYIRGQLQVDTFDGDDSDDEMAHSSSPKDHKTARHMWDILCHSGLSIESAQFDRADMDRRVRLSAPTIQYLIEDTDRTPISFLAGRSIPTRAGNIAYVAFAATRTDHHQDGILGALIPSFISRSFSNHAWYSRILCAFKTDKLFLVDRMSRHTRAFPPFFSKLSEHLNRFKKWVSSFLNSTDSPRFHDSLSYLIRHDILTVKGRPLPKFFEPDTLLANMMRHPDSLELDYTLFLKPDIWNQLRQDPNFAYANTFLPVEANEPDGLDQLRSDISDTFVVPFRESIDADDRNTLMDAATEIFNRDRHDVLTTFIPEIGFCQSTWVRGATVINEAAADRHKWGGFFRALVRGRNGQGGHSQLFVCFSARKYHAMSARWLRLRQLNQHPHLVHICDQIRASESTQHQ